MDSYDQHQGTRNLLAFMKENGARGDETVGDFLRRRVAEGCKIARGYLEMVDGPRARLYLALADAAAQAHPNWEVSADGSTIRRLDDADSEDDEVDRLIDWFQMTFPKEAKRIERENTTRCFAVQPDRPHVTRAGARREG